MKNFSLVLVVTLLLVSAVSADDIGLISIKNDYQAQAVRGIIDQAYTRVGQRYLASLSQDQGTILARAGIEVEIVIPDAKPSETYLIYASDRPGQARVSVPDAVEIGMGLKLVHTDRPMALGTEVFFGHKAVLLSDLQVGFRYIPKAVHEFLSALEDFPSDTLADLVDPDSVYFFDTRLEAFQTRYIWTDSIDAARDWMVQKFLDWGYTDVTTPSFYWNGGWHYNVMAVKPGWAEPDKVIVIGGHYDSITYGVSPGPMEYAPGADDDASGTTLTLELARILSDVPLRKTVIFMPFTAEEVGLLGSADAARNFRTGGTNLEVMLNFDMIGHDPDDLRRLSLSSGENTAYRGITADAAQRVTTLDIRITSAGSSSDHFSFYTQGFDIVNAIETDFNDLGWHTNLDVSTRMNFPYFTDVVRMAAASMGVIANSAHPTHIADIIDQGDGQSVEVFWTDCDPTYTYTLRYGTVSGSYPYSIAISPGQCSYVVDGLNEGQPYFFCVVGEVPDAYPAAYTTEASGESYIIPRAPVNLYAEPEYFAIGLDWDDNREADFSHYRVYRDGGEGMILYQDNVTESSYLDNGVEGLVTYTYEVTAVDFDMYESDPSNGATALAYTFDQGILLVDETYDDFYLPSQAEQEAYFDSIFGGITYAIDTVAGTTDTLARQTAGSYSSMFWVDDESGYKDAIYSEAAIDWYLDNHVDAFMAGWKTITSWQDSPIDVDHPLYEDFGVQAWVQNDVNDFVGAAGQNGWPSVQMDSDNLWQGKFPFIPALTPRPGATVIYTYDSFTDNPVFEGQPCGLLYETDNGTRIILAFPVYFLTASSSNAVIQKAANLFGETGAYVFGDVDESGNLDPLDCVYMVDYFWRGGPAPVNANAADVDGSCAMDVLDPVYIVDYFYRGGPAPVAGCVY